MCYVDTAAGDLLVPRVSSSQESEFRH
jgi:hypothetical protein